MAGGRGPRAARRRARRRGARGRPRRLLARRSSATASCAGSARRRASSTSRPRPSSTPSGTSWRSAPASRVWQLLADMTPERARRARRLPLPDRRADARRGARDRSSAACPGAPSARPSCCATAIPAYTTSVGWLGYDDDKIRRLCREALADGLDAVQDEGRRRPRGRRPAVRRSSRDEIGPDRDAGGRRQPALGRRRGDRLDGARSRRSTRTGSRSRPAPTTSSATRRSPAPWRRSGSPPASTSTTGSCSSSSSRPSAIGVCQIDACRLGGVNEVVAVLLLAAKFGVPVCPHAGGVGPVRAGPAPVGRSTTSRSAARLDGRMIEYVDHLHEHFVDPVVVETGATGCRRGPATAPRCGRRRSPATATPDGAAWQEG